MNAIWTKKYFSPKFSNNKNVYILDFPDPNLHLEMEIKKE